MTRIAVLGANGQVGAELCLLLSQQRDIEVVPICRNKLGSAYLRYRGLSCRHGQPADPVSAKALFGDCDVIANLALVASLNDPHGASATNAELIKNVAMHAAPHAKHIYFSTMSVYGDKRQNEGFAFRNSYAQGKWRTEKLVKSWTRRVNGRAFIFRLGHVCGDLQGITQQIRKALRSGQPIAVTDPERASNTVYVATIVDAILQVVADRIPTGTYDLMNVPQWTWREVFVYESRGLGRAPIFRVVGDPARAGIAGAVGQLAGVLAGMPRVRKVLGRLAPFIPNELYRSIRAWYSTRAARTDIQRLQRQAGPLDAMLMAPVGSRFSSALGKTELLLSNPDYQWRPNPQVGIWPADVPRAVDNPASRSLPDPAKGHEEQTPVRSVVVSDAKA